MIVMAILRWILIRWVILSCKSNSFVCSLVWGFRLARELFKHLEMSPLPVKSYKFWPILGTHGPLSNEGSLVCHTYCDTGMVISEDPRDTHTYCRAFDSGAVTTDSNIQPSACDCVSAASDSSDLYSIIVFTTLKSKTQRNESCL